MRVLIRLCLMILSICLISNLAGCAPKDSSFEWLDINAVPRANTEYQFSTGVTYGELAGAYIDLKQQCRATNNGVNELQVAQDKIKGLN